MNGTGAGAEGKTHDAFSLYLNLECGGDMILALQWNADLTKANRVAYMKAKEDSVRETQAFTVDFNSLFRKK